MKDVKKVLVLGSRGLIGSSVISILSEKYETIGANRTDLDFRDTFALTNLIRELGVDTVINAAGRVAGIQGNIESPADLLIENAHLSSSVLQACHTNKIKNYIQFASACVYPLASSHNSNPEDIGVGVIEQTSKSYAAAKILAIEGVRAFSSQYGHSWLTIIPSNVYGPGDWHSGSNGHVVSMLTERIDDAVKNRQGSITIWGDGQAIRNFLHVEDLACAVSFILDKIEDPPPVVNANGYEESSILQIAQLISKIAKFDGNIERDLTRPNGAPRKNLDDSYLRQNGWTPRISLREGLIEYVWRFQNDQK
jgi:GDP-L-fucose synthase